MPDEPKPNTEQQQEREREQQRQADEQQRKDVCQRYGLDYHPLPDEPTADEAREDTLRRLPVDELLSHVHEMVEGGNPTELILALKALPLDEF